MPRTTKRKRMYNTNYRATKRRKSTYARKSPYWTKPEVKFLDKGIVQHVIVSSASMAGGEIPPSSVGWTTPAQGDTNSSRDGRVFSIHSMHFQGIVQSVAQLNQTIPEDGTTIYLAMVLDKRTNGAEFISEELFSNPSADALTCSTPVRNLGFLSKFQILKTVKFDIDVPTMVWDGTNMEQPGLKRMFSMYHTFNPPLKVETNATGDAITAIEDNSVHLVGFCSDLDLVMTVSCNGRCRFSG